MKEYASQVEMCKVGEFIVDLYESKDGHVAVAIVDPFTDTVKHVVWVSRGLGGASVVHIDGCRLVLRARSAN